MIGIKVCMVNRTEKYAIAMLPVNHSFIEFMCRVFGSIDGIDISTSIRCLICSFCGVWNTVHGLL